MFHLLEQLVHSSIEALIGHQMTTVGSFDVSFLVVLVQVEVVLQVQLQTVDGSICKVELASR